MSELELVQQMSRLADRMQPHSPATSAKLRSLELAISDSSMATPWAGIDVVQAFDCAAVAHRVRNEPLTYPRLAQFERARNILALAPVLLTWLGLLFATGAYQEVIQADPSLLQRPFLLLWQEGFDNRLPAYEAPLAWLMTLSHVAFVDVVLVFAIIGLTFLVHREVNVKQVHRESEARDLEDQLSRVAWEAALVLAERGSSEVRTDHLRVMTEGLLDELAAQREYSGQVAQQRAQELSELATFVRSFSDGSQDLVRLTRSLQVTYNGVLQVSATLEGKISELLRVDVGVQASLATLADSIAGYQAAQAGATADLVANATRFGDGANDAVRAAAELKTVAAAISASLGQLAVQLTDERQAYERAAQKAIDSSTLLSASTHSLESLTVLIHEALGYLRIAGPSFAQLPEKVATATAAQSTAATSIADAASSYISQVGPPQTRLLEAASDLSTSAKSLASAADSLARATTRLTPSDATVVYHRRLLPDWFPFGRRDGR